MSTTLPLFWNLSSAKRKERLDASVKLVTVLETLQASHVPVAKGSSDEEDEEDEDEEDAEDSEEKNEADEALNLLNAADVSYSIRRLIRGLASPRESSRLGFSVALTELLSRIDTVTSSQILSLILSASQTTGSLSGQEERDLLFARLFGLTSLIQSGLLTRQTPLPSSSSHTTSVSNIESFTSVITELLALGEKKSWLRESAWWTLGLAVESLSKCGEEVEWKDQAVDEVLEMVFGEKGKMWGPEKVALAVKMQRLWPGKEWRKLLGPTLKHGDVLHTGNMVALSKILREADVEDDEDAPKVNARSWKPQVHYVWDVLLDELVPPSESTRAPKGSFQEFFRIVVDESLFANSASIERKYWGFAIFQKALPRVKASDLPMLFTKNFMRTWINHLSHFDRYLHSFAKQIAGSMQTVVQKDPTIGFSFILQLTGVHGSQQFDKLTKTKTVESLLTTMDTTGVKAYIDHLLNQFGEKAGEEQEDIQVINSRRSWIIDQLAALLRNGAIPKNDEWLQTILNWFTVYGMFIVKKKTEKSPLLAVRSVLSPPLSDELRKQCRARLLSCLAELTSQSTVVKAANGDESKAQKLTGVASDGEFWVAKVLQTVEQLRKDTKHAEFVRDLEEDEVELGEKAVAVAKRLHEVTGEKQETARGAELLILSCLLQLYASDETASSNDNESLEACIDGATRLFPEQPKTSSKKSKKSQKASEAAVEEEQGPSNEPIDVLVDTIIGFMERATAYMRAVGNQSFSMLSGAVEGTTVDLILSQLERRDPSELLADEDEDDEMDDAKDEDEDAGDEDVEDEDDDESEDEGGGEDESEGDEPEDPELRRKITEVLRANGIEAATGESDEESEEEEMDDDQMIAIDDQLAQIFKEQRKGKGKDENAQREATHFKNRILDLVDIFIKRQPTSPLIIRLIIPLVDLVLGSGSDERQLSDKTGGLLRSRIGKLKDVPSGMDKTEVTPVLEDLHTRARKVHSADALAIISQCSLYVSKVLLQGQADEAVAKVYRDSLVDFITRKASDLNAKFFDDLIKRHPAVAWGLRDDLISLTSKAVNTYRQCQGFNLIHTLVNQMPSLEDRQDEFVPFMTVLSQQLQEVIMTASRETTHSAAQMKDLFKLALLAVRQTKRYTSDKPEDLAKVWKSASWNDVLTSLTANDRFKTSTGLQSMCKQVLQLIQAQSGDGKIKTKKDGDSSKTKIGKRKADDAVDESPVVNGKKAKRKKSKTT